MLEQGQEFKCKNLLSFRKSITQNEMKTEMESLDKFMKGNNIKAIGPKITTTYSISQAMVQTMDIEILVPVDHEFNETDKYKFKSEIKLMNCLKGSYKGNPQGFNNAVMEIQKYISENKITPITSMYIVTLKEVTKPEEINDFEVEMYVSISPNIV